MNGLSEMSEMIRRGVSHRGTALYKVGVLSITAALIAVLLPCCLFCCDSPTTEYACEGHRQSGGASWASPLAEACGSSSGGETLAVPVESFQLPAASLGPDIASRLPEPGNTPSEPGVPAGRRPGVLKAGLYALHCVSLT